MRLGRTRRRVDSPEYLGPYHSSWVDSSNELWQNTLQARLRMTTVHIRVIGYKGRRTKYCSRKRGLPTGSRRGCSNTARRNLRGQPGKASQLEAAGRMGDFVCQLCRLIFRGRASRELGQLDIWRTQLHNIKNAEEVCLCLCTAAIAPLEDRRAL